MLKKLIISLLVICLTFNLIMIDNYSSADFKEEVKAPINLIRNLEKNQYQIDEEFIINYTIQPQNISIEDVYPEYYLADKEIVLVMDISNSMSDEIGMSRNIEIKEYINKTVKTIALLQATLLSLIWRDKKEVENTIISIEENLEVINNEIKNINVKDRIKEELRKEVKNIEKNINKIKDDLKKIELNKKYIIKLRKAVKKINKSLNNIKYSLDNIKEYLKTDGISKIEAMKLASKRFLEKLKDNKRIKVSLIPYETRAWDSSYKRKDFADLADIQDYNELIQDIDGLEAKGGTNIGDGLRKAYYKLKNSNNDNARKYIILMTDGEPTAFSYDKIYYKSIFGKLWSEIYFKFFRDIFDMEIIDVLFYLGEKDNYQAGDGTSLDDYWDLEYAKLVGEKLIKNGGLEIKSFMIGFSNDANLDKLKQIADSAGGYFRKAEDGDALDDVYQALADEIKSDLLIHNVVFKETIPDGFKVIDVSDGLEIKEGNIIEGYIESITYKLDKEKKVFTAEPINFWIKLKAKEIGNYQLGNIEGENESYISYVDIDGKERKKYFPIIDISVYETKPPILDAQLFAEDKVLKILVNEPSYIEVLYNNETIGTIDCREDIFETDEMKEFTINLQQDFENSLIITATDLSGNKLKETIPYLKVISVVMDDYEHNDLERPASIKFLTEKNSIIEEISINDNLVEENRVTDEGFYKANVTLNDGLNKILVKVRNQYNNYIYKVFKLNVDAKPPVIETVLKGLKLITTFDEAVDKVWIEADLNNDGVISGDEIFDSSNIDIKFDESNTQAEITLKLHFFNKQIKLKARDINGNIGFKVLDLPKFNRIISHGILLNKVQIRNNQDESISIVNGYETRIGLVFSIDNETNNLTLHFNKDKLEKLRLLGEFKVKLYEIIKPDFDVREVTINQNDIIIQPRGNEITININLSSYSEIFEKRLLLVYNFRPFIENINEVVTVKNRAVLGEETNELRINVVPLPILE